MAAGKLLRFVEADGSPSTQNVQKVTVPNGSISGSTITIAGAASPVSLTASGASEVPLTITLAAAQTANALTVKNSGGTTIFAVSAAGSITSLPSDAVLQMAGVNVLEHNSGGGWFGINSGAVASQTRIYGTTVYLGSSLKTFVTGSTGFITMTEGTAPSAPSANEGILYLDDSGGGKTRLMIRFNTGAAQQIAIEP